MSRPASPLVLGVLGLLLFSAVFGAGFAARIPLGPAAGSPITAAVDMSSSNSIESTQVSQAEHSMQTGQGPPAREDAAMAYDAKDGYVVMYGGFSGGVCLGDTWTYANGTWTQIFGSAPSARCGTAMAYDAKDGYVVLFGGVSNNGVLFSGTFAFSHGHWTQIVSSPSPRPSIGASIVYDAKDGYVVLFGGEAVAKNKTTYLGGTWTYSNGTWTQLAPVSSPAARAWGSMAYDAKDGYVVLFGGDDPIVGGLFGGTWTFAHGKWTQLHPNLEPAAREYSSMTYDATDGYLVLFGGGGHNIVFHDTWTYVNGNWTKLSPPSYPISRFSASMTYDSGDGYALLFGGIGPGPRGNDLNDTWSFVGGNWTQV
jgi:hypothetical protein